MMRFTVLAPFVAAGLSLAAFTFTPAAAQVSGQVVDPSLQGLTEVSGLEVKTFVTDNGRVKNVYFQDGKVVGSEFVGRFRRSKFYPSSRFRGGIYDPYLHSPRFVHGRGAFVHKGGFGRRSKFVGRRSFRTHGKFGARRGSFRRGRVVARGRRH